MTPKEAELLRAVESAARGILALHNLGRIIHGWHPLFEAIQALSAYRAQPQEATGETVDVRAVVTMTPDGKEWTVMGSDAWSDDDAETMIRDYDPRDERRVAIITARVPLIVIPTVTAKVVT